MYVPAKKDTIKKREILLVVTTISTYSCTQHWIPLRSWKWLFSGRAFRLCNWSAENLAVAEQSVKKLLARHRPRKLRVTSGIKFETEWLASFWSAILTDDFLISLDQLHSMSILLCSDKQPFTLGISEKSCLVMIERNPLCSINFYGDFKTQISVPGLFSMVKVNKRV